MGFVVGESSSRLEELRKSTINGSSISDLYFTSTSPNNDGVNDRFTLYSDNGSGEIIEVLRIFDRWGNQVFAADQINLSDESLGWDGNFQGKPAKPQVYVYQALIRYVNGAERWVTGDVTLIR